MPRPANYELTAIFTMGLVDRQAVVMAPPIQEVCYLVNKQTRTDLCSMVLCCGVLKISRHHMVGPWVCTMYHVLCTLKPLLNQNIVHLTQTAKSGLMD